MSENFENYISWQLYLLSQGNFIVPFKTIKLSRYVTEKSIFLFQTLTNNKFPKVWSYSQQNFISLKLSYYTFLKAASWIILHGKSRIRETKHLLTDAESSTDTKIILLVRQNLSKNFFFCALRPHLAISFLKGFRKSKIFGHWNLGSRGKKTFKWTEQM